MNADMNSVPLILIVDDDSEHGVLVGDKLKKSLKVKIKQVFTAEECLECVGAEPFDALLIDFALPKMNGLELLRRLVEMKLKVPAVIVTGNGRHVKRLGSLPDLYRNVCHQ